MTRHAYTAESKLTAIAAREEALQLITKSKAAIESGQYGSPEKPLEIHLSKLTPLLQSRLGGATPNDRVHNPSHIVNGVLILMNNASDFFRNLSDDPLRCQLAAALHAALDLVVIDSYEEAWINLSKTLHTTRGNIKIETIIENFRRGKELSWTLQYELDCCIENVKALLEEQSDWVTAWEIIKLGMAQDIGGLLDYANELRQKIVAPWQIAVLLMRRITPLAQHSAKALTVLQTVMATHCKPIEFYCHYAAQEALHNVIADAKSEIIQRQAMGLSEEIKSTQLAMTLWGWVRNPPSQRSMLMSLLKTKSLDRYRYRLIQGIISLLIAQMEQAESSPFLLNAAIEMLLYLKYSEPRHLTESRQWIEASIERIKNDKPKEFYLEEFKKAHPDFTQKHLITLDQQRIASLKKSLEEERSQQEVLKESQAALEKKCAQLISEQAKQRAAWKKEHSVLIAEKMALQTKQAELSQSLETARDQITSSQHGIVRQEKRLEHSEWIRQDLMKELSGLKQKPIINAKQISEREAELKQEEAKFDELHKTYTRQDQETEVLKQQEIALAATHQQLAAQEKALAQREEALEIQETSLQEREKILKEETDRLGRLEAELKAQQEQMHKKEQTLTEQQENLQEREDIMKLQLEEIRLSGKLSSSHAILVSPTQTPASSLNKSWLRETFDETFCRNAEKVTLSDDFMCPVEMRPAYDAVTLRLEIKTGTEEHLLSDVAARRWLIDEKQNSCPCCRQPVKEVSIPRTIRKIIKEKILSAIPLAATDPSLIALPLVPDSTPPLTPMSQNLQTLLHKPKPEMKPEAVDAAELKELLRLIVAGEQTLAEAMIKKNPALLWAEGTVTDGRRTFKSITAFRYILWTLDFHMWSMMRQYLPIEELKRQLDVAGKGAEYQLDGKTIQGERYFNLQPLLNAGNNLNNDQGNEAWYKVGLEQGLLPAHFVNEYTRPNRSFIPCPDFLEKTLPRTREVSFFDGSAWVKGDWFTQLSPSLSLGSSFAFYRGNGVYGVEAMRRRPRHGISADLLALKTLWETRIGQFESLHSELATTPSKTLGFS